MLTKIYIKNFTIIKELNIDFNKGFTTLTGDSGSGKSLLVKALNVVLGGRASPEMVRSGSNQSEIIATFHSPKNSLSYQFLEDHELLDEEFDDLIIRRTINKNGTRCYINDTPVKLATVKSLSQLIIYLHSQNDHQQLMSSDNQLKLLDEYAGIVNDVNQIQTLSFNIQQLKNKKDHLLTASKENDNRVKLLQYQIKEIEELNLKKGEVEDIENDLEKMEHASEYKTKIESSITELFDYDNEACIQKKIALIKNNLPEIPELENALSLLDNVIIEISEIEPDLQAALSLVDIDEDELTKTQNRLSDIEKVAEKNFVLPEKLYEEHIKIREELNALDNPQDKIKELDAEIKRSEEQYISIAKTVSEKRKNSAKILANTVSGYISKLRIAEKAFDIKLISEKSFSPRGNETVEFLFCPNKSLPFQPLNKIASGGELSRVSLAIQLTLSGVNKLNTIVFDEVDVGISGKVSSVVGSMLRSLGQLSQVICITHQPQVAAKGHHHLLVQKENSENDTFHKMFYLTDDEKINEIARLISGEIINDVTLNNAKQLLSETN